MQDDTIYAMATAPGRSAVAVCRISGPRSREALTNVAGRVPAPRRVQLLRLKHPESCDAIDDALVLFFEGPRSYTGEDSAELQVHGGMAVARALSSALRSLGLRPAGPGEFTRRAFLNGKLDLAQAEGIADLVDAETEFQRRQALRQSEGLLSQQLEAWRGDLIRLGGQIAAELDFSNEGDVGTLMMTDIIAEAARMRDQMRVALKRAGSGERTREGLRVVIAGAPNAGKSTLLNALARRDVAIVSDQPGTTRDALDVHFDLGGYPMMITDTAGLRASADTVERIGMERALARAAQADLVLWLVEPGSVEGEPPADFPADQEVWTVATKSDIHAQRPSARLSVSAQQGSGLDRLESELERFAREKLGDASDGGVVLTRERHRIALESAVAALDRLLSDERLPPEIIAEEIRAAQHAVGLISGRIDVEEILGEVFGRFCIGK